MAYEEEEEEQKKKASSFIQLRYMLSFISSNQRGRQERKPRVGLDYAILCGATPAH